ncbi:MAG: hypothetical protein WBC93_10350 [Sulfitobacter sp.]
MGVTEDISDELARETLKILDATGDDSVITQISSALGGYSQTMEEAYLTAVRVRRAEQRARLLLDQIKSKVQKQIADDGTA